MLTIKIIARCGTIRAFDYNPKNSSMEPSEALKFYEDLVKDEGFEIKEIIVFKPMEVNQQ